MVTLPTDLQKADLEELVSAGHDELTELRRAWEEDGHSFEYKSWAKLNSILTEIGERELRKYAEARR